MRYATDDGEEDDRAMTIRTRLTKVSPMGFMARPASGQSAPTSVPSAIATQYADGEVAAEAGQPGRCHGVPSKLTARSGDRQRSSRGSVASISARYGSSHGGSFSSRPSAGSGSSTVNPGAIVATSNSTPPGSRK